MKKIFSIIMLAAAVSLVTLSACGDASDEATPEASEEAAE
jgi:predicted small lipoprotein YifL